MKRNYWIHGKAGIGKSTLAKTLCGKTAFHAFHDVFTPNALERIFLSETHIILDNFSETTPSASRHLLNLVRDSITAKGTLEGTVKTTGPTDYEVLVIISEAPPQDEKLIPYFTVIETQSIQSLHA
jgi:septin family protein